MSERLRRIILASSILTSSGYVLSEAASFIGKVSEKNEGACAGPVHWRDFDYT